MKLKLIILLLVSVAIVLTLSIASSQDANPRGPDAVRDFDRDGNNNLQEIPQNTDIPPTENPPVTVGNWVSIGPTKIASEGGSAGAVGKLNQIAIDPLARNVIYVALGHVDSIVAGSGVWKTTNSGTSWFPITDNLPTLNIRALAIAPSITSRIYIVTPKGVYRSDNSGSTWAQVSSMNLHAMATDGVSLLIDPSDPNILYLPSYTESSYPDYESSWINGIYRSVDGGANWTRVLGYPGHATGSIVRSLTTGFVMDPSNPNRLFAAIRDDSAVIVAGIYESPDRGTTWAKLYGCDPQPLPANDTNTIIRLAISGSRLYASFRKSTNGAAEWKLYRTTSTLCHPYGNQIIDWRWEMACSTNGDAAKELWSGLYADPSDPSYVYATGTRLYVSTNGGSTFNPSDSGIHVDDHGFAVDPVTRSTIYVACDGGIYKSLNRGGGTWTFVGEGIANVELYDFANASTDPSRVVGGTQDNGPIRYDGSSTVWQRLADCGSGDTQAVAVDPMNSNVVYVFGQGPDQLCRSTDGGLNNSYFGDGLPGGSVGQDALVIHPTMPSKLYLVYGGSLYAYNSAANPPWAITTTPGCISRLAIDASVNLYYAGSCGGQLYAGAGGMNWQTVFTHPSPAANVTDLDVDSADPTIVYVSFGGTGAGRIYRMRRVFFGIGATDITGDLPNGIYVKALAIDRMVPFTIYAATGINADRTGANGIYRGHSPDGGVTWAWTPYNNGLPSGGVGLDIRDLIVHPATGVMRLATYGRGAYEVKTSGPTPTPTPTPNPNPFINVTASASQVAPGGSAVITVSCSAAVSAPLTVHYSTSGRAILGTDYSLSGPPALVTIGAGHTSAQITLHSLATIYPTSTMLNAKLTLQSGPGYNLGSQRQVTIRVPKKHSD